MRPCDYVPSDPAEEVWDAVIIGTGAGGATAGFNLARLGRSVLFLERGALLPNSVSECNGTHCLSLMSLPGKVYSKHQSYNNDDASGVSTDLLVGYGVGGSTAFFAMTMERFRRVDFTPREYLTPPLSSIPREWPISYDDLARYYSEAEVLFRVRGTHDPLSPDKGILLEPPSCSEAETELHTTLESVGLNPYRLHYASEGVVGCDGCPGKPCFRSCRNDATRICVLPALQKYGAKLVPECMVTGLTTKGRKVQTATCLWQGRQVNIRARTFVLALNAILTPALLLRSANSQFPEGLGNSSGMVGRNLMLHVSDLIAARAHNLRGDVNSSLKYGMSLNDFYVRDQTKLGNIHIHARDFSSLKATSEDERGVVFIGTIVEDFPYSENAVRVTGSDGLNVNWEYRYPDELWLRSETLVNEFAAATRSVFEITVRKPTGILNPTHACGTCRFGRDSRSNVLDPDNRVHDLDNVYVLDSSFFPSSSGINPSLTIIANSLRVSELIASR